MGIFDELKNIFSGEQQSPAYFIIGSDEKEYGPYQKEEITQFLSEGRIGCWLPLFIMSSPGS